MPPPPFDASGGASDFAAILDDAPDVPGLVPDFGGYAHADQAPAHAEQRMKGRNAAMRFVPVPSLGSVCERML